jgi:hypothetical protein
VVTIAEHLARFPITYLLSVVTSMGEGGGLFDVPGINILETKLAEGTRVRTIKIEMKLFTA